MTFTHVHDFTPIPVLSKTKINGKRYYVTEGGLYFESTTNLPSVTTVLDKADPIKNIILKKWMNKVGEIKAAEIKNKATSRGNKLHAMCQNYLMNEPIDFKAYEHSLDSIDMFKKLQKILDSRVNNIRCVETTLYSTKLGVAGTVDCIGEWDRQLSVIDFKNSKSPKKAKDIWTYFLQASAYALMFSELTQKKITQGIIMMAVEDIEPQLFIFDIREYIKPLIQAIQKFNLYNPTKKNEVM